MATSLKKSVLGQGSDFLDEDTQMCEPCSVAGDYVSAHRFCSDCQELLCKKCSKSHMSMKRLRNHALLTLDDMQKAPRKSEEDKGSYKCETHTGKTIKYFCEDHSLLGCSVCITTQHKQCDEPIYIPTAAAEIPNQSDYKQFESNLKYLETAYKAGLDDVEKLLKQVKADGAHIKTTFNDFRKRLNDALDKFEGEVTTKAKVIAQEETGKLKSLCQELERSLGDVDALSKKVATLLSTGQRSDVYVTMKREESQLSRLSGELDAAMRERAYRRVVLNPNTDVLKSGNLGRLNTRTEKVGRGSYAIPGLNPQHARHAKRNPGKAEPASRDRPSPAAPATRSQYIDWVDMARQMKLGDRVRRGRDWDSAYHLVGVDEDDGGLGTVVGRGGDWWWVRWDCGGGDRRYRMGGQWGDVYDLQIVEN